jgi:hypothetical protein
MIEEAKSKIDDSSFLEKRASHVNDSINLEGIHLFLIKWTNSDYQNLDELNIAYNQIKANEKELKSVTTIAEFLFDSYQELQLKIENDY